MEDYDTFNWQTNSESEAAVLMSNEVHTGSFCCSVVQKNIRNTGTVYVCLPATFCTFHCAAHDFSLAIFNMRRD